jgi:hypothetical protein
MEKSVSFGYGILTEPLEKQANDQGYTLGDKADFLDKLKTSANMCGFHLATEAQVSSMFTKLHKKVMKELKPLDK